MTQIVEGRGYYPDGKGGLVLLGEYSRRCPVECVSCEERREFNLCTDELLSDDECDELLNKHLESLGWTVTESDRCPHCSEAS